MSDPKRSDVDPAMQVASELRARLRTMEIDQLIELCAQLMTTYVIEGVAPTARANDANELTGEAGEETFAQLLKRLKASRKDPVLDRFIIDGENISVRIDGQGVLPITEYRRPVAPPAAPGVTVQPAPRRESAPGAASSIYNRALYQPDQPPPQRAQPAPRTAPQPATAATPQPATPQPPQKDAQKPAEPRDRFSLIELE